LQPWEFVPQFAGFWGVARSRRLASLAADLAENEAHARSHLAAEVEVPAVRAARGEHGLLNAADLFDERRLDGA